MFNRLELLSHSIIFNKLKPYKCFNRSRSEGQTGIQTSIIKLRNFLNKNQKSKGLSFPVSQSLKYYNWYFIALIARHSFLSNNFRTL